MPLRELADYKGKRVAIMCSTQEEFTAILALANRIGWEKGCHKDRWRQYMEESGICMWTSCPTYCYRKWLEEQEVELIPASEFLLGEPNYQIF